MILYLINALAFSFSAVCWSRAGWHNVTIGIALAMLAMVNGSIAAPMLLGWLQ